MKVFAYYYPGFFDDTYRISGNEWELLKKAKPKNAKHYQPRIPSNGYYNQIDSETCKSQIKLAQEFGIDGFMICFYWDFENSKPIMNEPLECIMDSIKGTDFKFNLMWVLRLPHKELPIKNGAYGKYHNHPWLKKRIQSFKKDTNFNSYINKASSHPNYRKGKDGRALFQVYSVSELIELHHVEVKSIFNQFTNLHLQGICGRDDIWIEDAEKLGLNSLSSYVTLVDFNSKTCIHKHKNCVIEQPKIFENIIKKTKLPYFPSVSSGWDASPRGTHTKDFRLKKFPWAPVVIDPNPHDFEKNLWIAKEVAIQNDSDIHIASWNEWTEGHYIEPDEKFGTLFLEKIANLKKS